MSTLEMRTSQRTVSYHLEDGALAGIAGVLAPYLGERRAFVVSDANVGPLHAVEVAARLASPLHLVPAGEEHKTWASVERTVRWLLDQGAERGDVVVAVGGGVLTDLAGFAASVTLRGVAWIAAPTTLLGMVDAAIGGKTGIDLDLGKNLIGTFWQPLAVVADPGVLATLAPRQLRSGMVEVVKAAMIAPAALQELLDRHAARVLAGELAGAGPLILGAVAVKAEVVAADERERGARAALNLGHTVGHALEAATGYRRFLHGEAVAWGLLVALRVAVSRGRLAAAEARAWAARLEACGPLPSIGDLEWAALAPFIGRDKKRAGGEPRWVLPRTGGVDLGVAVGDDEAARAWEAVKGAGQ